MNTNHPDFIGGSNAIQASLGHGYAGQPGWQSGGCRIFRLQYDCSTRISAWQLTMSFFPFHHLVPSHLPAAAPSRARAADRARPAVVRRPSGLPRRNDARAGIGPARRAVPARAGGWRFFQFFEGILLILLQPAAAKLLRGRRERRRLRLLGGPLEERAVVGQPGLRARL